VTDSVQLVIFDLMGTLVRNVDVVTAAYDAALGEAGLVAGTPEHDAARHEVQSLLGRPTLDVLTAVLGDPVRAEEATWAFDDLVIDSLPAVEAVAGATDTLDELGSGLVVGVTSGAHGNELLQTAPHTHLIESVASLTDVLDAPRTVGHRRSADR